jgi:hypothetical protein
MNLEDSLIFYNWMPCVADLVLDYPDEYYRENGTIREHDTENFSLDDIDNMEENCKIFIKTDFLKNNTFQNDVLPHIKKPFILISGMSSFNVDNYQVILDSPYLIKWFCTNPPCKHDKLIGLPIGFEERNREGGNQEVIFKFLADDKVKINKLLLPYHTVGNNPARDSHINYLQSLPFVDVQETKLPFSEYLELLSRYKYCICLEGAGFDTHRNYESLLVGTVPIMKNSSVKFIYDDYILPSVFVDAWTDIDKDFFDKLEEFEFNFDSCKSFLTVKTHMERIERYV